MEDNDLMPPITRRELPADVRRNREIQAATDDADRLRYEQAINARLTAFRIALDALDTAHQLRADQLDFDLVADTRPAAMWQMAGRCIGIARLILDALALGYTSEVLHLARALHKADRLLDAFCDHDEADLLRSWLADEGKEWVRPSHARGAEARFEQRLADAMTAAPRAGTSRTWSPTSLALRRSAPNSPSREPADPRVYPQRQRFLLQGATLCQHPNTGLRSLRWSKRPNPSLTPLRDA